MGADGESGAQSSTAKITLSLAKYHHDWCVHILTL